MSERSEYRVLAVEYDRLLERLIGAGAASPAAEIAALRGQVVEVDRRRRAILAEMAEVEPRLALLEPPVVDRDALARFLGPDTLLLSYLLGDDHGWLLASHQGGLTSHRLAPASELQELVDRFRRLVASPSPEGSQPALLELGSKLYAELIAPVGAAVLDRTSRILVVPHRALHRLPFAALVTAQPAPQQGEGGLATRFLIERASIHYGSSASTQVALARRRAALRARSSSATSEPRWTIAAFGDPRYDREPDSAPGEGSPTAERALRSVPAQLPWSKHEVRSLASLFVGAATFLGDDATEHQARTVAPLADVLHFAVHGFADSRLQADSGLMFTPPAERERTGGDAENGLLQAWEILESLSLDAELVTLSACETAMGEELSGEGVLGLPRAFQLAGASTVVASQWRVLDRSTAALMEHLYRRLAAGEPVDQALRGAQLALLSGEEEAATGTRPGWLRRLFSSAPKVEETGAVTHPYYWAGFAAYGLPGDLPTATGR